VGTGDKGGDVRIGEITLPDGGETRDCGVIVSCAGGSIRIGGLCCWRLEHLVGLKRGGTKLWMRDEMTLRLIHRIHLISTRRGNILTNMKCYHCAINVPTMQQDRSETDVTNK
jgi:hypothetical protein